MRPFDALPREALQLLAFSCGKRTLKGGETLFSAGERADGAFFVLDGEIVLRQGAVERRARAGALIGEAALFATTERPCDATAPVDTTLLVITYDTFHRVLTEFPNGARAVRRSALERTGAIIRKLERLRRRAFVSPRGA